MYPSPTSTCLSKLCFSYQKYLQFVIKVSSSELCLVFGQFVQRHGHNQIIVSHAGSPLDALPLHRILTADHIVIKMLIATSEHQYSAALFLRIHQLTV